MKKIILLSMLFSAACSNPNAPSTIPGHLNWAKVAASCNPRPMNFLSASLIGEPINIADGTIYGLPDYFQNFVITKWNVIGVSQPISAVFIETDQKDFALCMWW